MILVIFTFLWFDIAGENKFLCQVYYTTIQTMITIFIQCSIDGVKIPFAEMNLVWCDVIFVVYVFFFIRETFYNSVVSVQLICDIG